MPPFASRTSAKRWGREAPITSCPSRRTSPCCGLPLRPNSPRGTRPFPPYTQRERAEERTEETTCDKGHGRVERRTLTATSALNFYVREHLGWSSVRQVFRVVRQRVTID